MTASGHLVLFAHGPRQGPRRLVRILVLPDPAPPMAPGTPLRVPLVLSGHRTKVTVDAVGIPHPGAQVLLSTEVPLKPGTWTLTSPALRGLSRRFLLWPGDNTPVQTFCEHAGTSPSVKETLLLTSLDGGILAVATQRLTGPCCHRILTADGPPDVNAYELIFQQPLDRPLLTVVDGKAHRVEPGQYLLVHPLSQNHIPRAQPVPFSFQALEISQAGLDDFFRSVPATDAMRALAFSPEPQPLKPEISQAVTAFVDTLREPDLPGALLAGKLALHRLLLAFLRHHPVQRGKGIKLNLKPPTAPDARLEKALRLIETRYAEPCRVAALAKEVGLSVPMLWRIFQRHLRMSPKDYLQAVRMEKAKGLLQDRANSLSVVAKAVGYNDVRSFRRVFKSHTARQIRAFRGK